MDMLGFIDWASEQDLDAVEPTSYFFLKEITPEYLAKLRRRAHLQGVDISSGAIRNVFTLNKWHAPQIRRPLRRHRLPHHPRLRREGPKGHLNGMPT